MTDSHIEKILTEAFLTLNDFSGKPYIKFENGKPTNVSIPNIVFPQPTVKQFFVLTFLPNEPDPAGLGTCANNRWTGIFQIDIITPLGAGQDESNVKYEWISKLFERGKSFGEVLIKRTYRATQGEETAFYRSVIRVEFTASLPK